MNPRDRNARKQLILDRIALERVVLRNDLAVVRHSLRPIQLIRAAMTAGAGPDWLSQKTATAEAWLPRIFWLLKKYRWAATLLAGVPAMGRWLRRKHRLGVAFALVSAVIAVWRAVRPSESETGPGSKDGK